MNRKNNIPTDKDFAKIHHYWIEYGVLASLKKQELLVYLAILRFADYETKRSDISISIISQLTRVSQPKIGKITDKLANLGMIRKEWEVYKTKLRKNHYYILIPKDYKPLFNPKGYTAPNQDSIDDSNTTPKQVSIESKDTAPISSNILPRFDGKYCPELGQTFREVREIREEAKSEGSASAFSKSQASPSEETKNEEETKSLRDTLTNEEKEGIKGLAKVNGKSYTVKFYQERCGIQPEVVEEVLVDVECEK